MSSFVCYMMRHQRNGKQNIVMIYNWLAINQCIPFHVLYCVFMYMPAFILFILLYCQQIMKWSLF